MPIVHTKKGWFWGSKGPFPNREKAVKVAQAIFASGWREKNPKSDKRFYVYFRGTRNGEWIEAENLNSAKWILALKNGLHSISYIAGTRKPLKNPFPQVCGNCGAIIYGVFKPVKCPKCGKPWKEAKNPRLKLHSARELYCPICKRWHRSGSKMYDKHYGGLVERQMNPIGLYEQFHGNPKKSRYSVCECGHFRWQHDEKCLAQGCLCREFKKPTPFDLFEELRHRKKTKMNPSLYEAFHGNPPKGTRVVNYENPKGTLIKIGRLSEIKYKPEYPSQHKGVEFYHKAGDTGNRMLKSNMILATDSKGKNLYLIKDKKTKYPVFTGRGIIG